MLSTYLNNASKINAKKNKFKRTFTLDCISNEQLILLWLVCVYTYIYCHCTRRTLRTVPAYSSFNLCVCFVLTHYINTGKFIGKAQFQYFIEMNSCAWTLFDNVCCSLFIFLYIWSQVVYPYFHLQQKQIDSNLQTTMTAKQNGMNGIYAKI